MLVRAITRQDFPQIGMMCRPLVRSTRRSRNLYGYYVRLFDYFFKYIYLEDSKVITIFVHAGILIENVARVN